MCYNLQNLLLKKNAKKQSEKCAGDGRLIAEN